MENMEIERKFTLNALPPDYENYPHSEIWQGYLCTKPTIRVRRDGDAYYLTYKGKGGLVHTEYNLPLTEAAFLHLAEKIDSTPVEKTRYRIPYRELTVELDIFSGSHEGLAFAEVEFSSVEEAEAFLPPDWFAAEVTDDPRFRNTWLASHPGAVPTV